jgi:hypothetical protein
MIPQKSDVRSSRQRASGRLPSQVRASADDMWQCDGEPSVQDVLAGRAGYQAQLQAEREEWGGSGDLDSDCRSRGGQTADESMVSGRSHQSRGSEGRARRKAPVIASQVAAFAQAAAKGVAASAGSGPELADPALAMLGGASQPERRRRPAKNTQDGTHDWKMPPAQFTAEARDELLVLIAQLVASTSLKCKIITAIALFKVEIVARSKFELEAKVRTKAYHDLLMDLTKPERRGSLPPFILVVEATVDVGVEIAYLKYARESPVALACIAYQQVLKALKPADRSARLLADWRYCRYGGTWTPTRSMFEIGLSPIHTPEAASFLRAILPLLEAQAEGHQKYGVAPKTKLELRLETVMQQLGVWQQRGGKGGKGEGKSGKGRGKRR